MNALAKIALLGTIVMYVVSPFDMAPGPIDDILVMVLGLVLERKDWRTIRRVTKRI